MTHHLRMSNFWATFWWTGRIIAPLIIITCSMPFCFMVEKFSEVRFFAPKCTQGAITRSCLWQPVRDRERENLSCYFQISIGRGPWALRGRSPLWYLKNKNFLLNFQAFFLNTYTYIVLSASKTRLFLRLGSKALAPKPSFASRSALMRDSDYFEINN